jgi:hypothetical protein
MHAALRGGLFRARLVIIQPRGNFGEWLLKRALAITLLYLFVSPASAVEILDGGVFRADFDFSGSPMPPEDVMVRFFDVVMTPQSDLEMWTVSLFDDPATKLSIDLHQNASLPASAPQFGFSFSLNCPCSSGLPQELSDQKGFFQTSVAGGTLSFANAVAVYRYFQQPGAPEITQPIVFTRVIPEPNAFLLLLIGGVALTGSKFRRRVSA